MAEPAIYRRRTWVPVTRAGRGLAAALLLIAGGLLAVACWLQPNDAPALMGTHTQLGLSPCGFALTTGLPCPSCGMTTAFAWTVRGRLDRAFVAQPAGLALALAAVATVAICLVILVTGRRPLVPLWFYLHPTQTAYLLGGLFLAGWAFKMVYGWALGTLPPR